LTGKPLVKPVCQDDIAIRTESGAIVLVRRGQPLPFPAGENFAVNDDLALPRASENDPVEMRVEVVAGDERRVLFSQPWKVPAPTSRGEPLRLEYRYDGNQVLELRLRRAEFSRSAPFEATIENPLSHVANPQVLELKVEAIEQEIGPGTRLSREARARRAYELAGLLEELGRREKALDYLKALLRERTIPEANLYNRIGNVLSEMNAPEQAERAYRDAMKASLTDDAAAFNLALLLRRHKTSQEAAEAADEAVRRNPSGPHLTLRAQIANDARDEALRDEMLLKAAKKFGAPRGLTEWELGWLQAYARLAGDRAKEAEAKAELRRRIGGGAETYGELPMSANRA
jgi:tetratricopeptide (TPR) repeat protein